MKAKLIKYIVIPTVIVILFFLILITMGAASIVAGNQTASQSIDYAGLSEEVEAYRNKVEKYAKDNGIGDYVDHLLCIMQVSTSGVGTDVMNAGEFEFNTEYPKKRGMITDPDYSIQCGVKEFKALLDLVGVTSTSDNDKLLIVYQAYHINRGYINYCSGKYTPENSKTYCEENELGDHFNADFANQVAFYLQSLNGSGEFKYPLKDYHSVSSPYGYRYSPTHGNYELHSGTDFPAPKNTPVLASMDGVVERAEVMGGYGNCVVIRHNSKYQTYYAHNTSFAVSAGDSVKQGDVIAYVGSTGNSTGPHCHFEIRINGHSVDPMPYLTNKTEVN